MTKIKSWLGLEAPSLSFYILLILFLAVFTMGGSSRSDVQSLAILRPLYVITAGIAICMMRTDHFLRYKYLIFFMIFFVFLHLYYFLPHFSRGDALLEESQYTKLSYTGDRDLPGMMALDPDKARNSFFSIFLPISIILLAIQLRTREHVFFLKFVLLFGCLSGVFGFFQIIGGGRNYLYLYEVSNVGSSVGLFANRNHQSVFLAMLLPMLATYACLSDHSGKNSAFRGWVAISCSALIIPLILITGSRGGLLVGLFAVAISYLLYLKKAAPRRKSRQWQTLGALFGIVGIGMLTVIMSRAEAWDRLFESAEFSDGRSGLWTSTGQIIGEYFPSGTGPGGFSAAFTSSESPALLDPTYLNHAHNDWLEWVVTFGLPGIIFLLTAITFLLFSVVQKWKKPTGSGQMRLLLNLGVSIIILIGIASVGDYPLRTPTFSCIFALALCWTMGRNIDERPTEAQLQSEFQDDMRASPRTTGSS